MSLVRSNTGSCPDWRMSLGVQHHLTRQRKPRGRQQSWEMHEAVLFEALAPTAPEDQREISHAWDNKFPFCSDAYELGFVTVTKVLFPNMPWRGSQPNHNENIAKTCEHPEAQMLN